MHKIHESGHEILMDLWHVEQVNDLSHIINKLNMFSP